MILEITEKQRVILLEIVNKHFEDNKKYICGAYRYPIEEIIQKLEEGNVKMKSKSKYYSRTKWSLDEKPYIMPKWLEIIIFLVCVGPAALFLICVIANLYLKGE